MPTLGRSRQRASVRVRSNRRTGRRRYQRPNYRSRSGRTPGGSGAVETFARVGFVTRGILYLVIGAIALMMAFGSAHHDPDRSGALEVIAAKPFGYLLLWLLTIGFAGLAVWRIIQAADARLNPTGGHRLNAAACAVAYTLAFITTLTFVMHGRAPASSDSTSRDLTARVMSHPGGRALVVLVGLGIVCAGVVMVMWGVDGHFTRHLRMGWMSRDTQDTVVRLGQFGYVARGAICVALGLATFYAAATYHPSRARGLDGVLRSFATSPVGPWLLVLVAAGLIAFGVFSFFEARWRRTYGGVPV